MGSDTFVGTHVFEVIKRQEVEGYVCLLVRVTDKRTTGPIVTKAAATETG